MNNFSNTDNDFLSYFDKFTCDEISQRYDDFQSSVDLTGISTENPLPAPSKLIVNIEFKISESNENKVLLETILAKKEIMINQRIPSVDVNICSILEYAPTSNIAQIDGVCEHSFKTGIPVLRRDVLTPSLLKAGIKC